MIYDRARTALLHCFLLKGVANSLLKKLDFRCYLGGVGYRGTCGDKKLPWNITFRRTFGTVKTVACAELRLILK
jgi:hypothetical protein